MDDGLLVAIMIGAVTAIGIGLDRLSRWYADHRVRLAEDIPAIKDETSALRAVRPQDGDSDS